MSIVKSIKSLNTDVQTVGIITPNQYRGLMSELFLPGGQGPLRQFTYENRASSLTAYERCPPLTAIINKKAAAYINGTTWVMDEKGKEAKGTYADKLRAKLAKPNPIQTWKQFEAQQSIIIDVFGFSILFPVYPVGFSKDPLDATWWNVPPSMLKIQESGKVWKQTDLKGMINKITLSYGGEETDLDINQLYTFKDFLPSFSTMLFPESRISSLALPINNIIGAMESRNVLINYRGALGILTSKADKYGYVPIKQPEKDQLQADFRRYGLRDQQWKFIITSAAVEWQQMGIPTRELMLFEEIEDDTNMLCDSYGYPIDLMAGSQRKTYQNAPEARKALYQETTIPDACSRYDQWNAFLKTADNKVKLEKDYSHVSALQKNKGEEATARKTLGEALNTEFKNNWITYNRVLELLGEDTVRGMDKYYRDLLDEGYVFGDKTPAPATEYTEPSANGNGKLQKIKQNGTA